MSVSMPVSMLGEGGGGLYKYPMRVRMGDHVNR